jgi:hypothetical protein
VKPLLDYPTGISLFLFRFPDLARLLLIKGYELDVFSFFPAYPYRLFGINIAEICVKYMDANVDL